MIDFHTIASGSSGNTYILDDGKSKILIEMGIPITRIKKALDFNLSSVAFALCGHLHSDHSLAIKDVMKAGIDVYANRETFDALHLDGHRAKVVVPLRQFSAGTWDILPFEGIHDVPCLGFLMVSKEGRALYLSDSNFVKYRFKGLNLIALGVGYSVDILKENVRAGRIDPGLANRILRNHMSLETALDFFKANDMSRVEEIHLLHLSDANSDEERFLSAVEKATGRPVYVAGKG